MDAIDFVVTTTRKYIEQMPKSQRKKCGQFFTSKETAVFMARLLDVSCEKKTISILDPGAGTGLLTAAVMDELNKKPTIEEVYLTCYENNQDIIELLQQNLEFDKNQGKADKVIDKK